MDSNYDEMVAGVDALVAELARAVNTVLGDDRYQAGDLDSAMADIYEKILAPFMDCAAVHQRRAEQEAARARSHEMMRELRAELFGDETPTETP